MSKPQYAVLNTHLHWNFENVSQTLKNYRLKILSHKVTSKQHTLTVTLYTLDPYHTLNIILMLRRKKYSENNFGGLLHRIL